MNASSVDIADMLVAETSLGLTIKTNLFVGKEPTEPKNCVTLIDNYGYPPALTLAGRGEGTYYYPSVQVRIRNTDYRTGFDLAMNILSALHGRHQETWNGTLYTVIRCTSGPALLGWDDGGLCHLSVNFDIQRR